MVKSGHSSCKRLVIYRINVRLVKLQKNQLIRVGSKESIGKFSVEMKMSSKSRSHGADLSLLNVRSTKEHATRRIEERKKRKKKKNSRCIYVSEENRRAVFSQYTYNTCKNT